MFKTFSVLKSCDNTWTGGSIHYNENFMNIMDSLIKEWCEKEKLSVAKVDYSIVNENIQHGSASFNVEKRIYLMAAVQFQKL